MTLGSSFRRVAKPHLSKLRCSCMAFVRLVLNCSTLAIQRWHFVARAWNRLKPLSNVKRCKTVKNPMLLLPVQVGCIRLAETWKRRRRVARVLARSAMLQGFYFTTRVDKVAPAPVSIDSLWEFQVPTFPSFIPRKFNCNCCEDWIQGYGT